MENSLVDAFPSFTALQEKSRVVDLLANLVSVPTTTANTVSVPLKATLASDAKMGSSYSKMNVWKNAQTLTPLLESPITVVNVLVLLLALVVSVKGRSQAAVLAPLQKTKNMGATRVSLTLEETAKCALGATRADS